ncbi:AraC family transcriptional regulator [Oceanicoccus sagamiensis]|uniref:HTH araC/xylS-type domain-containing protein n=1 Tax=Oceanicoccus sagamiensis TaxID=716816 RepID=A0A1X9NEC6_9GAMM|nr:AraC family transcriptional regulator [Oceanicoccus sagamiensis]ARN75906.1 hypothetical protein BST96_18470 [Oceanicoccus sagamiensis]
MPPKTISRTLGKNLGRAQPHKQLLHSYEIQLMIRNLVEQQAVALTDIIQGSGVAARELDNPAHRLTLEQELALYTNISHLNNDPLLALRTGARLGLPNYGILGYAMMGAATVREALQLLVEFAPLVSWASHSKLSRETVAGESCLCLSIFPTPADTVTNEMEVESTMASLQTIFNELVGEPVLFAAIDMAHPLRAKGKEGYSVFFQCPITFAAGRNALLVSKSLLDRRLPHAQPEYAELLKDLCRETMSTLTEDRGLVAAVKAIITEWDNGVPTLEQVAEKFHQSSRTLRRHLKDLGLSYQAILDEVRFSEAKRYLSSTHLTVEAIGSSLGYADVRSFRVAFKRWSGVAPTVWRSKFQ